MKTYLLTALVDSEEEFQRDIEIHATHTFFDLHNTIQKVVDFDGNELASFFACNETWVKEEEITLLDMYSADEIPTQLMEKTEIGALVDKGFSSFVYEYDFLNPVTLFIRLTETYDKKEEIKYPRCLYSEGHLNKYRDLDPDDVYPDDYKGDLNDLKSEDEVS